MPHTNHKEEFNMKLHTSWKRLLLLVLLGCLSLGAACATTPSSDRNYRQDPAVEGAKQQSGGHQRTAPPQH